MQVLVVPLWYVPNEHFSQVVAPFITFMISPVVCPCSHSLHVVACGVSENVWVGHGRHSEFCGEGWYVPGKQGRQNARPGLF